jgi:hypothetical protein
MVGDQEASGAYGNQVVMMQGQLDAMEKTLAETARIASNNERAVNVAERRVVVAQENAIYAQRAYLSVTNGEIKGSGFLLRIENSGNSPANDVQMKPIAQMRSGALPVPDPGTTGGSYVYLGLIAPSGHFDAEVVSDVELSGAEQDELIKRDMEWWCAGIIRYQDVFGKTRHTKFCFSRHWLSDSRQPWIEGNEAD